MSTEPRPPQLGLFDPTPPPTPDFDGETYEPRHDKARLNAQLERVVKVMRDRLWRTLEEISKATGDPQASVSARLRDLRKPKFGEHVVERRRRGVAMKGLFEYRLTLVEREP